MSAVFLFVCLDGGRGRHKDFLVVLFELKCK